MSIVNRLGNFWGVIIAGIFSIIPEVIKAFFKDKPIKDEDKEAILEYCLRECPIDSCIKEKCSLFPITGGRR